MVRAILVVESAVVAPPNHLKTTTCLDWPSLTVHFSWFGRVCYGKVSPGSLSQSTCLVNPFIPAVLALLVLIISVASLNIREITFRWGGPTRRIILIWFHYIGSWYIEMPSLGESFSIFSRMSWYSHIQYLFSIEAQRARSNLFVNFFCSIDFLMSRSMTKDPSAIHIR